MNPASDPADVVDSWFDVMIAANHLSHDALVTEYSLLRKRIKYLKLRETAASEIEVCLERMYSVRTLLSAKVRANQITGWTRLCSAT